MSHKHWATANKSGKAEGPTPWAEHHSTMGNVRLSDTATAITLLLKISVNFTSLQKLSKNILIHKHRKHNYFAIQLWKLIPGKVITFTTSLVIPLIHIQNKALKPNLSSAENETLMQTDKSSLFDLSVNQNSLVVCLEVKRKKHTLSNPVYSFLCILSFPLY